MRNSSDSEDDPEIQKLIEASDTTLLSEHLYKKGQENNSLDPATVENIQHTENKINPDVKGGTKSLRYLNEECNDSSSSDLHVPEALQLHIAKKVTEIIAQQVKFVNTPADVINSQKPWKSKVRLLSGTNGYVKSYEEFEYDTKGPTKKPNIKRRIIDDETYIDRDEKCSLAAVDAQYIISGDELKFWAEKPVRQNKIFNYKLDSKGNYQAKEAENEFTQLRMKNKWNVNKIKQKIKH